MHNQERSIAEALQLVGRFASTHYPNAAAALLAGSAARGVATLSSDYDVILLFDSLPEGAWREMVDFEGHDFEVFAHDLATLSYFFREIEKTSGLPVLARMVAEGLLIEPASPALVVAAKQIALDTLESGAPPLNQTTIELRRYAITDLAQALSTPHNEASVIAIGTSLYTALADFFLRATGQWSATGKATPSTLSAADPKIADPKINDHFTMAFLSLFKTGDATLVQALVDDILTPHGGRMRAGFKQLAPTSWRDRP
jgi:predicted nucleotidyltransferase